MSEEKRVLILDMYDHKLLINTLNEKRTNLIKEQKTTDAIDEILIKTIDAPKKRLFKKKEKVYETR